MWRFRRWLLNLLKGNNQLCIELLPLEFHVNHNRTRKNDNRYVWVTGLYLFSQFKAVFPG